MICLISLFRKSSVFLIQQTCIALVTILSACVPIALPNLSPELEKTGTADATDPVSTLAGHRVLKRVLVATPTVATDVGIGRIPVEPPARGGQASKRVGLNDAPTDIPRVGKRTGVGVTVTPELGAAYEAYSRGDFETMLSAAEAASRNNDAESRWVAGTLQFEALLLLGRSADAEIVAEKLAPLERSILGHDVVSLAMRGLARLGLGDYRAARADLGRVAHVIGAWNMPVFYIARPSNVFALGAVSGAKMRAYTGLAMLNLMESDYVAAWHWSEAAEGLFNDLYYVLTHPMYGSAGNYRVMLEAAEGRAHNLMILGASRSLVQKDLSAGKTELDEALKFFRTHGHRNGEATILAVRAMTQLAVGKEEEAFRTITQAGELAATAALGDLLWQIASIEGEIRLAKGQRREAEAAFRRAQNAVEFAIGNLASGQSKLRFGSIGKEKVAQRLVEFDIERRDYTALFRDMERARARAFVDMLAAVPVARGRQSQRVAVIRELDRKILRQRLMSGVSSEITKTPASETELLALRTERVAELRRHDPELADTLAITHVDLPQVQARLSSGETLVYTIPDNYAGALRLLLITREGAKLLDTGVTHKRISELTVKLANTTKSANAKEQEVIARAISSSLKLAEWGSWQTAYVVPSGAMHFVPWGALEINYPVVSLPTGAWLIRSTERSGDSRAAVIVGDPDFRGVFEQLPGARKEAIELGYLYQSDPLIGGDATENRLRDRVGAGVDVLHLATHGFFDVERPLASSVVLSGADKPVMLTAAKLFEVPLSAKLVVLSACDTGIGQAVAGDDLLGLPRSFYLGGARAVVSSLWPVDDASTKLFMETFHQHAKNGNYGAAWLAARNQLRSKGFPPSVYGAFVLGGAAKG